MTGSTLTNIHYVSAHQFQASLCGGCAQAWLCKVCVLDSRSCTTRSHRCGLMAPMTEGSRSTKGHVEMRRMSSADKSGAYQ